MVHDLFGKPASIPDRVGDRLFPDHALEKRQRTDLAPPTFGIVAGAQRMTDNDDACGAALLYQPCLVVRLGGVSGGNATQGWRDSSHTAMVGAGKFGSAKLPTATATNPGKCSLSQ